MPVASTTSPTFTGVLLVLPVAPAVDSGVEPAAAVVADPAAELLLVELDLDELLQAPKPISRLALIRAERARCLLNPIIGCPPSRPKLPDGMYCLAATTIADWCHRL
jgi:hypothetical protein